jgi:hypothetical protein
MMYSPALKTSKPFSNRLKFFDEESARAYLEWVKQFRLTGEFSLYFKTETEYEIK